MTFEAKQVRTKPLELKNMRPLDKHVDGANYSDLESDDELHNEALNAVPVTPIRNHGVHEGRGENFSEAAPNQLATG